MIDPNQTSKNNEPLEEFLKNIDKFHSEKVYTNQSDFIKYHTILKLENPEYNSIVYKFSAEKNFPYDPIDGTFFEPQTRIFPTNSIKFKAKEAPNEKPNYLQIFTAFTVVTIGLYFLKGSMWI